jgi:hypothetical protein
LAVFEVVLLAIALPMESGDDHPELRILTPGVRALGSVSPFPPTSVDDWEVQRTIFVKFVSGAESLNLRFMPGFVEEVSK